jgi:hypothetical protein
VVRHFLAAITDRRHHFPGMRPQPSTFLEEFRQVYLSLPPAVRQVVSSMLLRLVEVKRAAAD